MQEKQFTVIARLVLLSVLRTAWIGTLKIWEKLVSPKLPGWVDHSGIFFRQDRVKTLASFWLVELLQLLGV